MKDRTEVTQSMCVDGNSSAVVFTSFNNFDKIMKLRKDRAAFFATQDELDSGSRYVKELKKKKKKATLGLRVDSDVSKKLKKLAKKSSSKKLKKYVRKLAKSFKKSTKQSLKYVLLPANTRKTVSDAFKRQGIKSVVASTSVNKSFSKFLKNEAKSATGVIAVKGSLVGNTKNLKRLFKKLRTNNTLVSVKACVSGRPDKLSKKERKAAKKAAAKAAGGSNLTVLTTEANNDNKDLSAVRSRGGNTLRARVNGQSDAQDEATDFTATETDDAVPAGGDVAAPAGAAEGEMGPKNGASSLAATSVFTLAAIAAVASFML